MDLHVIHIAALDVIQHNSALIMNMNAYGMTDIMNRLVILLAYLPVILLRWKNARLNYLVLLELIIHLVFLLLGGVIPKGLTILFLVAADNKTESLSSFFLMEKRC